MHTARTIRTALLVSLLFKEAGLALPQQPPPPLSDASAPAVSEPAQQTAAAVPPEVVVFLNTATAYDKDWPPAFTKWAFESTGTLSSDAWLYASALIPDQLSVQASPKTWKAFFYGQTHGKSAPLAGKASVWNGKALSWRLQDSRAVLANAVFTSAHAYAEQATAPRACVAVYALADGKLIASIEAPLTHPTTTVRLMKHFSYNRLVLMWGNTGVKRGFTIPDHVPLRLVIGVTAAQPNEAVAVTLELQEGEHL